MEPVSLSASAVCDIFSLGAARGRLAATNGHRCPCRSPRHATPHLSDLRLPREPPSVDSRRASRDRRRSNRGRSPARLSRDARRRVPRARKVSRHRRGRATRNIARVSGPRENAEMKKTEALRDTLRALTYVRFHRRTQ